MAFLMSKLIESLKAGVSASSVRKSDQEMTQQELADIYFSGSEKLRKSDQPLVIKVIEKPRAAAVTPWVITSIAFLLLALSLFSTKRVFVDIKVVDDKYPALNSTLPADPAAASHSTPSGSQANKDDIRYGDKLPIQEFVFEGAAKLQSSKDKSGLTLVNSSVAPFARASLYLRSPMNLRSSKIVFHAKGARGGEHVTFSIKDRDNLTAFKKGRFLPFPNGLSTDWQRAEIPIFNTEGRFDEQNVAALRFDIGSKDTENKPGDMVFIRDLQITPI